MMGKVFSVSSAQRYNSLPNDGSRFDQAWFEEMKGAGLSVSEGQKAKRTVVEGRARTYRKVHWWMWIWRIFGGDLEAPILLALSRL